MAVPLRVSFVAGATGAWRIARMDAVSGAPLAMADRLTVATDTHAPSASVWTLNGIVSNVRYATREEAGRLADRQEGLGRAGSTCAALIPIRKTPAWWALAQDERRAVMEDQSRHIAIGLEYLPAIARRLHHSRDLGEPFDFLTWFEYAPEQADDFERLVSRLRASAEWRYVDREVDIRLAR